MCFDSSERKCVERRETIFVKNDDDRCFEKFQVGLLERDAVLVWCRAVFISLPPLLFLLLNSVFPPGMQKLFSTSPFFLCKPPPALLIRTVLLASSSSFLTSFSLNASILCFFRGSGKCSPGCKTVLLRHVTSQSKLGRIACGGLALGQTLS